MMSTNYAVGYEPNNIATQNGPLETNISETVITIIVGSKIITIVLLQSTAKTSGCFDQAIGSSELQHDNPMTLTEAYQLQCLMVPNSDAIRKSLIIGLLCDANKC